MQKMNLTKGKLKIKFVKDRPGHDQRYSLIDNSGFRLNKSKFDQKFEDQIKKTILWYFDKNNLKLMKIKKNSLKRLGLKKKWKLSF